MILTTMRTNFQYKNSIHKKRIYSLEGVKFVDTSVDLITQFIVRFKTFWEPDLLELIRSKYNPKGVWLDVGANIGNHTVFFAGECEATKVIAFEPYATVFNLLQKNYTYNKAIIANCELHNVGLSDKEQTIGLYKTFENNVGANSVQSGTKLVAMVDLITLDSLDLQDDIVFIKIDVESHEINVLNGAVKTITKNKPIVYTEIRYSTEFNAINNFFTNIDYTLSYQSKDDYIWVPKVIS